jgi:hypothetical protein
MKFLFLMVGLIGVAIATTSFAGPTISVSVSPTVITDQGDEATFTLHAAGSSPHRAAVNIVMSGTASQGSDYVLAGPFSQGRVVFEPGQASVTVLLHAFDVDGARREFATMNIIGGSGYRVGSPNHATVRIDNVR